MENELKKLKTIDLSYFIDKSHFEEDGIQNYLAFHPIHRYFNRIASVGNGDCIYYWQSKGLSDERINSIKTSDYGIIPKLSYYGIKIRVEFNGSCSKQDEIMYAHGKTVNIYIVCEIFSDLSDDKYLILQNVHSIRSSGLLKSLFYRINIFIDFNKSKFVEPSSAEFNSIELCFNEQSRM